jgi:hypothetical protein
MIPQHPPQNIANQNVQINTIVERNHNQNIHVQPVNQQTFQN